MCVYLYIRTCVYTYIYRHVCIYVCVGVYIHMCMYVCVYIHIYIYNIYISYHMDIIGLQGAIGSAFWGLGVRGFVVLRYQARPHPES